MSHAALFEDDPDLDSSDDEPPAAAAAPGARGRDDEPSDEEELDDEMDEDVAGGIAATNERFSVGASVPNEMKGLRSCLRCMLVKTYTQFYDDGCDNCPFLELRENRENCNACTTPHFEGLLAMMQPEKSWVARWQRIGKSMRTGCYAIKVQGALPDWAEIFLDEKGIPNLGKMSQQDEAET